MSLRRPKLSTSIKGSSAPRRRRIHAYWKQNIITDLHILYTFNTDRRQYNFNHLTGKLQPEYFKVNGYRLDDHRSISSRNPPRPNTRAVGATSFGTTRPGRTGTLRRLRTRKTWPLYSIHPTINNFFYTCEQIMSTFAITFISRSFASIQS
jgi:hypothetical protein